MKKLLVLLLLVPGYFISSAQEGYHEHDGFFLSMSLGPAFGNVNDKFSGSDLTFRGAGIDFDIKIGGKISQNLLLHATLLSKSMVGPEVSDGSGQSGKISNNVSIGEAMFGAGLTYYIMPQNIFLSGSMGAGNFTVINTDEKINTSTKYGFSFQLKAGKEWWVGKNWGLGLGLAYGKTSLTNDAGGISEQLNSNRFSIVFNATFN
jgi:hypothetical protein